MNILRRTPLNSFSIGLLLCAMAGLVPSARARETTLWQPEHEYHTIIRYDIAVENAELEPGKEKSYHGRYKIPSLHFAPVIGFRTSGIERRGNSFYARRQYERGVQTITGLDKVSWESDNWMINPRRWYRAWCRWRDDDIDPLREEIKAFKRAKSDAEEKGSLPTEEFAMFYDAQHNVVLFDWKSEQLYFKWDVSSFDRYMKNKSKALDVQIGPLDESSTVDALKRGWEFRMADPNIQNTILSEFGISATAVYDDPTGKHRLIENRDKWNIDAGAINGLLATPELRKLINFTGQLQVRRYRLKPSDCEKRGLAPFDGWKIRVLDSTKAEIGYDTGNGYETFPITISADVEENFGNTIEFWFDAENEALRYAKVEIRNDDYEGNIPNPGLGKMLSKVRGTARGKIVFKAEYQTAIDQKLPDLD